MTVTYLEVSDKKYTRIIHVSDLHIRTGDPLKARYNEYSIVFKEFIQCLNAMDLSNTITVITGDLFHHKGKIEPAGIKLTYELFSQLLDKTPVIVICGNHDYRQDDPEIPDMIETLLNVYNKKYPLYYLNKTGHYVLGNVGFGVVDVRDTLKSYNTYGRYDHLPEFPLKKDFPSCVDYPLALFHGTVASKEMVERYVSFQGYPLEWIGDYSHILLGDIHKKQIHVCKDQIWAYPGSLIQQDFGESWKNHGFLEWELSLNQVVFHPVYNPYGLCTLKYTDKWWIHSHQKEWHLLKEICLEPFFPKKPMIRLLNQSSKDCEAFLQSIDIHPTRIQSWFIDEEREIQKKDVSSHVLEELNTPLKWMDYLKQRSDKDYSNFILHPESLKLPESYESYRKYKERNDKIQKMVDEYQKYQVEQVQQTSRVELVHLSWSYLMCYGESNHFDFKQLSHQIALLNGKNAMGKSSFLDILCIALYGEATKMRHLVSGKKYTDKIIHDQRPAHKVAPSVKLLVMVQDVLYEIRRVFGIQSAKHKEHSIMTKEVMISKIEGGIKTIVAEGNTMVQRWIETYIGSMESVLMSTMICQMDLNNFFHLKQEDQKSILDTALRLENVSLYGKIIKESLLAHLDIQSQIQQMYEALPMIEDSKLDYDLISNEYIEAYKHYDKHFSQKEYWLTKINDKEWKTRAIPDSIVVDYQYAKDQYDYGFKQEVWDGFKGRLEDEIRLEERMGVLKDALKPYEDIVVYKDSDKHLTKWIKKRDVFLKAKPNLEVTLEWIQKMKEKYQIWKEHQTSYASLEDIEKERESYFKSIVPKPLSECPLNLEGEFKVKEYQAHLLKEPEKYTEDTEWMDQHKEFEGWTKKTYDKVLKQWNKLTIVLEKQKELETSLMELESFNDFTFNPECKACQSNPFQIKKTSLEAYCQEAKTFLKKQRVSSSLEVLEEMVEDLRIQLENYKEYVARKTYMEWKKRLDWMEWKRYTDWLSRYTTFIKIYEDTIRYWREYNEWNQIQKRIEDQEKQHELYCIWMEEETVVQQKIQQFQQSMDKHKMVSEYQELMDRYNEIKEDINEWKRLKQIQEEYYSKESLYAIHKVREMDNVLKKEKEHVDKLCQQFLTAQQEKRLKESYLEQKVMYEQRLEEITNRIQVLQELDVYFLGDKTCSGYKEWIYEQKVIPMLNKDMNAFLSLFETFRFKMIYDKKQFIYMLEDRGNEPTLDKASGYQNFIISLAFRLALTRIGAIGQQLKHLFIDEGFTACDSSNIEKVPMLLKSILDYGQYHSILLMSHLESVRECTHTMIHIQREDPFSYIRFGEDYPNFTEKLKTGTKMSKK